MRAVMITRAKEGMVEILAPNEYCIEVGKELACMMQYRGETHAGRVYLEGGHLLFRGAVRVKILMEEVKLVGASDGVLKISTKEDVAAFSLGEEAASWADKILNPPSRLTKLGIRLGTGVALASKMEADFVLELEAAGARLVKRDADVTLLAVQVAAELKCLPKLAAGLRAKTSLWIVYPKGVKTIREADVLAAGRGAGLKDTKVASFSKSHTALRFSK